MDPGTAANRLVRDLLWSYVKDSHPCCFRCGKELDRKSFSIDHMVPWLDTPDPFVMFFDLKNIAYSHLSCNVTDSRKPWAYSDDELAAMPREERNKVLAARKRSRDAYHQRRKRENSSGS